MVAPYLLSSSTLLPVPAEAAYDAVMAAPLEELFPHRSGAIPAVRECRDQGGPWGTVGQTRTVVLVDGSTNLETLVTAERPGLYEYRLSDFTGPMKVLVAGVDGRFTFVPDGAGTRVTWSWAIHPTHAATRLALPVLGAFWKPWAAKMWPHLAARASA